MNARRFLPSAAFHAVILLVLFAAGAVARTQLAAYPLLAWLTLAVTACVGALAVVCWHLRREWADEHNYPVLVCIVIVAGHALLAATAAYGTVCGGLLLLACERSMPHAYAVLMGLFAACITWGVPAALFRALNRPLPAD